MKTLLTFWKLLYLLLGGLVLAGLGVFFKLSNLSPLLADGGLLLGLSCALLAKVLLIVLFVRWGWRVNRQLLDA
ncbi:hypothetical protein [Solirubrum puertoriconensis]|uniref:Uncharacterized protein n=1 Tax=Solirubrum puertoriconensis TaxID=1751427 RepID=A0A9X0HP77_SOLP1|nr:hypothetical protein [Solirubrum puertoriconensis]KUG09722.1 hypothetical protein ASU33_18740 [Solirubrum puertoriconensis]